MKLFSLVLSLACVCGSLWGAPLVEDVLFLYGEAKATVEWVPYFKPIPQPFAPPKFERGDAVWGKIFGHLGLSGEASLFSWDLSVQLTEIEKDRIQAGLRTASLLAAFSAVSIELGKMKTAWGIGSADHPTFFLEYQEGEDFSVTGQKSAPFLLGVNTDWILGDHFLSVKGFMDTESLEEGKKPRWGGAVFIDHFTLEKGEIFIDTGYLYRQGDKHFLELGIEGTLDLSDGILLSASYNNEVVLSKDEPQYVPRALVGLSYSDPKDEGNNFSLELYYREALFLAASYGRPIKEHLSVRIHFTQNLLEPETNIFLSGSCKLSSYLSVGVRLFHRGVLHPSPPTPDAMGMITFITMSF